MDLSDVSFPRYMLDLVKNTTRAERISCTVAVLLIIACIILIVYFTVIVQKPIENDDQGPEDWNITRVMWLAHMYNNTDVDSSWEPLRLVVIQHTASTPCNSHLKCCAEMRNLQNYYLKSFKYDIPYNFLIGNDGRVYEGRGWRKQGAHTYKYNKCTLGIGFFGDYREEEPVHTLVTDLQLNRTLLLLEAGVWNKYLDPQYKVVGAKDLANSQSPGSSLYNAIQKWKHYDHEHLYSGKTCDEIKNLPLTNN